MKPTLRMTIKEMLEILENVSEKSECDCDDVPPWRTCNACLAAGALNETGELFRHTIQELRRRGVVCDSS